MLGAEEKRRNAGIDDDKKKAQAKLKQHLRSQDERREQEKIRNFLLKKIRFENGEPDEDGDDDDDVDLMADFPQDVTDAHLTPEVTNSDGKIASDQQRVQRPTCPIPLSELIISMLFFGDEILRNLQTR